MRRIEIDGFDHPLYPAFRRLYASSFPIFEQRTERQQATAFGCGQYRLAGYEEDGSLVGFISYWEFEGYIYVEHFAIDTGLRGRGYGSALLDGFVGATPKIVLLEIDPVTDSVSAARLRFYRRCGFRENPYPHRHPAYRDGYEPHPLRVLTSQREISEREYGLFERDLREVVMNG